NCSQSSERHATGRNRTATKGGRRTQGVPFCTVMSAPEGSEGSTATALNRELRERFGFLREVVAEMERSVPYAAALAKTVDGVRLSLRDGEQQASRRDPAHG